jgi:hypothetical protein
MRVGWRCRYISVGDLPHSHNDVQVIAVAIKH